MAFPETPETTDKIVISDEIVCRVEFSPISRPTTETLEDFYEAIHDGYPLATSRETSRFPSNMPAELADLLRHSPAFADERTYWFGSFDQEFWISLGLDSFALSFRRDEASDGLRTRLEGPFDALMKIDGPTSFTHACVRFRRCIPEHSLPRTSSSWSRWLAPWVAGPLRSADVSGQVESFQTRSAFYFPEIDSRLDATYGLAEVLDGEQPEKTFVIDAHVFTERRLEPHHVLDRLAALHDQARRFIRQCITDELHDAM